MNKRKIAYNIATAMADAVSLLKNIYGIRTRMLL
jgi:hypothetical protein